jgi:autotransporter-associated beta strand protein
MHINPKSKFPAISNPVDPMKLRSFHQLLPFTLLTVAFTLPLAAQTSVTLDGASGNQIFNVARSTTGGLTIGLGFEVEYLVVGGGGGGGNGYDDGPGGGGGAGGLLQGNLTFQTATSIGVAVGTGGLANSGNGGNSSFGSTIALGGGGGGGSRESGLNGGSGGGAGGRPVGGSRIGGTASIGQGNSGGGNSGNVSGFGIGGGGGGGAGSAGASSSTRTGAAGGAGLSLDISGTNVSYAVGGSGGSGGTGAAVNASIIGGGGRGAFGGNVPGPAQSGGQGAAGIVIARYKGTSAGTGGTVTAGTGTAAGYTLHTFTSTGTSALDFSGLNLNSRLGAIENGVISGSGGLTFSGPGTLTLGGANTFTGDTRVGLGTLSLNHSNALAGSTLNMASSDDGTVAFGLAGNNTYNIGGITGSKNLEIGGNVLSVGANNANSTYSGQISGIGSLTKSGTSTLMMSGASSYTGATVVSDGLLVVNGSISTSILTTIQSGATLGGSGAVGALTVQAGGTVAPGNSPGILSTGNYNQAGTLSLELNGTLAGAEYDQVNVIGTVNLSGLLTATVGYTPVNDQLLFILNNDGSDAITGTFSGLADLDTIDLGGYQWRISYTANYAGSNTGTFTGGNDIALMAIPEPSALVFLGLSTFCIVSRRRRKA